MSTRSCFVPPELLDAGRGQWRALPEDTAHYLVNVLRLSEGTSIRLRDVQGRAARATLMRGPHHDWGVAVTSAVEQLERPEGRVVWLAPALFKKQRFSWMLEKFAELGADRVSFTQTERSVVRWSSAKLANKMERCQSILVSAARQSGAHQPPALDAPQPLAERAADFADAGALLVYAHPGSPVPFADVLSSSRPLAIFSGPEGGFTHEECDALDAHGAHAVSLGPRVLRAETAPVAMLSAVRMLDTRHER